MSLATLAQFRAHIAAEGTSEDTWYQQILDEATATIQSICDGRTLVNAASHTEYVDGDGGPTLWLREGPLVTVTSVASITYDGAGNESATALVSGGDYFARGLRADGWLLPGWLERRGLYWMDGTRNYKVVYTAGWDVGSVHGTLVQSCITYAVGLWNTRKDTGKESRIVGDATATMRSQEKLIQDLRTVLMPFVSYG